MRRGSSKLLVEPPSSATGDIAFNLIIFFLVCASVQPDSGRTQSLPRSEQEEQKEESKHIEVSLSRTVASINGDPLSPKNFSARLRSLLADKPNPEDRVVVVKSKPDVPYDFWIRVTGLIEEAGGMITIQREEQQVVQIPE